MTEDGGTTVVTVLACIDGSRYTAGVCDYAARAALRLGVGVELLHAIDRHPGGDEPIDRSGAMTIDMAEETLEEFARLNEARSRLLQGKGRSMLDQAAARVRLAGADPVQERLVIGGLIDRLREHEADARLIVIGKRGAGERRWRRARTFRCRGLRHRDRQRRVPGVRDRRQGLGR